MKIVAVLLVAVAVTVAEPEVDQSQVQQLADYFHEFARSTHTPCMVVAVRVGDFTWISNFGPGADLENHVHCREKTMLKVASVSKAIGAGLLAHLVEQGKLQWDVDVSHYLPEAVFPRHKFHGKPVNITVRQLVTHQAGIRHSDDQRDFMHDWEWRVMNATDLVPWFATDPLLFEPGHGFHYSNHGWSLLGAIVESVTGRQYHQVLESFMNDTVGMASATSVTRERMISHRGQQYLVVTDTGGHPRIEHAPITEETRPFPHWPAGGVLANIHDLLTFGERMLSAYHQSETSSVRPILNSSTIEEMWTYNNPNVPATHYNMSIQNGTGAKIIVHGIEYRYVMGWERSQFPDPVPSAPHLDGLVYISHAGQTKTANAKLAIIPEHKFIFATIANRGGLLQDLERIPIDVFNILFK